MNMFSGYNPNSPIAQSIMSGGNGTFQAPQNQQINLGYGYNPYSNFNPQQPVADPFMSAQFNGMGGYYNPYQGNNPYYQIYQKQQEAIAREQQRQQSDMWKKLSRNVNKALGEMTEEEIEAHVEAKYTIKDEVKDEAYYERQKSFEMLRWHATAVDVEVFANKRIEVQNQEHDRVMTEELPRNMTVLEYFDKAGEILLRDRLENQRKKNKDLTRVYEQEAFKDLLRSRSGANNYFNTIFNGNSSIPTSLDDMEIKLPPSISNSEMAKKRSAFIESIMRNKRSSV